MKVLLCSFLFALMICSLSFAQIGLSPTTVVSNGTLQTGFAVITPLTNTGEGLSVTETFGQQVGANLFQASVISSPLVTLTDVVANVSVASGLNTGVAIVNPNVGPATVTLALHAQTGAIVATRTIVIGARQQISRFVTELFSGEPALNQPFTGLVFISSDVPIGALALQFNGNSFTSLPVAAQLVANNVTTVPTTPVTTTSTSTVAIVTSPTTTVFTTVPTFSPTFSLPATPTFNGVPTPPTILPSPTATSPTTSFSVAPIIPPTFSVAPAVTTSTAFPQVTVGIGGTGAQLLPQVATGGGWASQITIANTSSSPQTVRVDFFNSFGAPMSLPTGSTLPSIVIAPGGVATVTI